MLEHFKHFNSAALVDAAKAYEDELRQGNKMMITLAGAMTPITLAGALTLQHAEALAVTHHQFALEDRADLLKIGRLVHRVDQVGPQAECRQAAVAADVRSRLVYAALLEHRHGGFLGSLEVEC